MRLNPNAMTPEDRKKYETLTWTALQYMREQNYIGTGAKILAVDEIESSSPRVIKFLVGRIGPSGLQATRDIEITRQELLEYYKKTVQSVNAQASTSETDMNAASAGTMSSPVTLSPKRKTESVPPLTWSSERYRLRFKDDPSTSRLRKVSGRYGVGLGCTCPASVRVGATTCDHIRYAYLNSLDAEVCEYRKSLETPGVEALIVEFPVGMGHYRSKCTLIYHADKKMIAVVSELDALIARTMGWPAAGYMMSLDEGMIGYIQYIEDLLTQTVPYSRVVQASKVAEMTHNVSCSRVHSATQRAMIVGELRPSNPERQNWMVANAACILETGGKDCLACSKLEIGKNNDVPDF